MSTDLAQQQKALSQHFTDNEVRREAEMFELAQRKANVYAKSTLVPKDYQNNVGNVLIAQNMAKRIGSDLLLTMQNLYVVHGRPAWSAKFLIATFNQSGQFAPIRYEITGKKGTDSWGCIARTKDLRTGDEVEGPEITIGLAKAEGWYNRKDSKWKTMPEKMLRYRAAAWMIDTTAPQLSMGLMTVDEVQDAFEPEANLEPPRMGVSSLESKLAQLAPEDPGVPEADAQTPPNGELFDDNEPTPAEARAIHYQELLESGDDPAGQANIMAQVDADDLLDDAEKKRLAELAT